MKKILFGIFAVFAAAALLITFVSGPVFSKGQYECFGWSACDDSGFENECAFPNEYVDHYLTQSYCHDYHCKSTYRVTCEDMDDGGMPYFRYRFCEALDTWNCEFN
jgi:hypothetical protein